MKSLFPLTLLLSVTLAAAAEVLLVDAGQARCSIVLPAEPDKDEQAAADDFARIMKIMTGAELAIAAEPQEGLVPVYIGNAATVVLPKLAGRLAHPDPLALINDRFLVDVSSKRIVLAGARPWGTRLAVTQFFEDQGCRWYGGGAFFEAIPPKATLAVATGDTVHTPDFEMRDVWYVGDDDLAHLKLQRHDKVLNHGHAWQMWIGKERKARDELRGLVQGERKGPLEYAHPDVPDIFVSNIVAYIERTGYRTISLSTDDGPVYSESAESGEWLTKEVANPFMATPAIADGVLRLFNKVIPRVLEKYPETVFGFLVYANTMTPPRYETVHPSIAVVGAPLAENAMVPTTTETDARRIHFRTCFENWMKLSPRGYVYEYEPFVIWHGVLCPRVELIRRNVPYYKSIGVRGMNLECRQQPFAESGLNIYVYSRLFWDTGADVDAILDEFCGTFYGPASEPMREWIRVTQNSILDAEAPIFGNEDHNIELIFTGDVMRQADRALDRAEKKAKEEPWKTRVQVARLIHEHTQAYLDSKDAMDRCRFKEAVAAIDRMFEIKGKLNAVDPALSAPADAGKRWDFKTENPPWIRGLRKQAMLWAALAGDPVEGEAKGKVIQMLPEKWTFAFDSENLGGTQGWQAEKELPGQRTIDIGQPWDYQGCHEPRTANGWYRTEVKVPKGMAGKAVKLYFTRLYGMKVTVWLDGKLVEHRDLPRYFWYNYHHEQEFDLTEAIEPGKRQVLTVRVFKEFDWGGPYGGAFVYSPVGEAE